MKVVFRAFPDGEVIALLCGTAKDCNSGAVMSYMHNGQHGEADRWLGRSLRLARREEYEPLKRELEGIYKETIEPVSRLRP